MSLRYYLRVLYHKLLRDDCVVLDSGFTLLLCDDICRFCLRPINEVGIMTLINSKKKIIHVCNDCLIRKSTKQSQETVEN